MALIIRMNPLECEEAIKDTGKTCADLENKHASWVCSVCSWQLCDIHAFNHVCGKDQLSNSALFMAGTVDNMNRVTSMQQWREER